MKRLTLLLWTLITIDLTTLWVHLFRNYYIFYHNLPVLRFYFFGALLFLLSISLLFRNKSFQFLASLGFSLYLAISLSMYPNLVNNPDVIKMLQLTKLIINGNYSLAKHVNYSAFPGFSYIFASVGYITGGNIGILLASSVYIVLSILFIFLTFTLGKYTKNYWLFLNVIFSLGFIFSFDYLSPQILGQIVLLTVFILVLKVFTTQTTPQKAIPIFLVLIAGNLVTHPESFIMTVILVLMSVVMSESSIFRRFKITSRFIHVFLLILAMTATYAFYFIKTFGPSYILRIPLEYLTKIHEVLGFLFGTSKGGKIITSATVKPSYIGVYSNINIVYSGILFLTSAILSLRQKMTKEVAILSSFVFSSALFLVIFGVSLGEFVGRTAFGASLAIGLILANFSDKVTKKNINILFSLLLGVMIIVSFIARIPPEEWNVNANEYYLPLNFLKYCKGYEKSYYFLYPNVDRNISLQVAEYVILPIGQVRYTNAMSNWFRWNAKNVMHNMILSPEYNEILYNNRFSIIMRRED